jgi:hypothetical protein
VATVGASVALHGSMSSSAAEAGSSGDHPVYSTPPSIGRLAVGRGPVQEFKGDLLVLPVFQPEEGEGAAQVDSYTTLADWDKALDGALSDVIAQVGACARGKSLRFLVALIVTSVC